MQTDVTDSQARLVADALHRRASAARDLFRRAHRSLVKRGNHRRPPRWKRPAQGAIENDLPRARLS